MLIEESRVFQVTTFGALHIHQRELDQKQVLLDVIVDRGRGGCTTHGSYARLDGKRN